MASLLLLLLLATCIASCHPRETDRAAWENSAELEILGAQVNLSYSTPQLQDFRGRARLRIQVKELIPTAPMEELVIDYTFNIIDAVNVLFELGAEHEFILGGKPQTGSFSMSSKVELGHRLLAYQVLQQDRILLDLQVEANMRNRLEARVHKEDWAGLELRAHKIPGGSSSSQEEIWSLELEAGGEDYTGTAELDWTGGRLDLQADFPYRYAGHQESCDQKNFNLMVSLNPEGSLGIHVAGNVYGAIDFKMTMKPDLREGKTVLKFREQTLGWAKLSGKTNNYEGFNNGKYNIVGHTGNFTLKYDDATDNKKLSGNIIPTTGTLKGLVLWGFLVVKTNTLDGQELDVDMIRFKTGSSLIGRYLVLNGMEVDLQNHKDGKVSISYTLMNRDQIAKEGRNVIHLPIEMLD